MKGTIFAAAALAATASAQLTDNGDGTFKCGKVGGAYCAGDSLSTNIIIRCVDGKGQPGNCNDNLAGIPPVGVKTFAPCYQSSKDAGDAACSWDGTAYPDSGKPFKIPGGSASGSATGTATGVTGTATGTDYGTATGTPYASSTTGTGSGYPNATETGEPTGSGSGYPTASGTDSGSPYPTGNSTATGTDGYPDASGTGAYGSGSGGSGGYPTGSPSHGGSYGNGSSTGPSTPTGTSAAGALRVGVNMALGAVGVAAFFML